TYLVTLPTGVAGGAGSTVACMTAAGNPVVQLPSCGEGALLTESSLVCTYLMRSGINGRRRSDNGVLGRDPPLQQAAAGHRPSGGAESGRLGSQLGCAAALLWPAARASPDSLAPGRLRAAGGPVHGRGLVVARMRAALATAAVLATRPSTARPLLPPPTRAYANRARGTWRYPAS